MNQQQNPDQLITLSQAAEIYDFNAGYLRELASRGRLEAKKIGSIWLTTPADVESFLASRQKRGRYKDLGSERPN